jgi:hypothetical protein
MESSNCLICDEKFSKLNYFIKCEYCCFYACKKCWLQFFSNDEIPICMNKQSCNKEWTRLYLYKNMPNNFMIKTYKNLLEKRAFDTQKALLPATMDLVTTQIELENIKKQMVENKNTISNLNRERRYVHFGGENYIEMSRQLKTLRNINRNLKIEYDNNGSYVSNEKKENNFIRACPDENCRGFIDSLWECKLCKKITCKECYQIKKEDHICNKDDVLTAKVLLNNTKPCPKCQEGIFKIDGCDQMWCIKCHTAFSWRSGRIETQIHNPHFYDWMRNNQQIIPRTPGDEPGQRDCIQFIDGYTYTILHYLQSLTRIYAHFITQIKPSKEVMPYDEWINFTPENYIFNYDQLQILSNLISSSHLLSGHLRFEIRNLQQIVNQEDNVKTNLRIRYLRQFISEDDFIIKIQRIEKDCNKKRDIINILTLLSTGLNDIMTNCYKIIINKWLPENEINLLQRKVYNYNLKKKAKLNLCVLPPELHKDNLDLLNQIQNSLNQNLSSICELFSLIEYCNNLMKEMRDSYKATKINITEYFGGGTEILKNTNLFENKFKRTLVTI